jgi:hypothetical protein
MGDLFGTHTQPRSASTRSPAKLNGIDRTAAMITSGGKRKPANPDCGDGADEGDGASAQHSLPDLALHRCNSPDWSDLPCVLAWGGTA